MFGNFQCNLIIIPPLVIKKKIYAAQSCVKIGIGRNDFMHSWQSVKRNEWIRPDNLSRKDRLACRREKNGNTKHPLQRIQRIHNRLKKLHRQSLHFVENQYAFGDVVKLPAIRRPVTEQ